MNEIQPQSVPPWYIRLFCRKVVESGIWAECTCKIRHGKTIETRCFWFYGATEAEALRGLREEMKPVLMKVRNPRYKTKLLTSTTYLPIWTREFWSVTVTKNRRS